MSRRQRLEKEVSQAQKRIKNAPKDIPQDIRDIWEKELIELEFDLNNLVDEDNDNNL